MIFYINFKQINLKSLIFEANEEPDFLISKEIQEAIAKVDGSSGWTGIGASQRVKIWDNVLSLYKVKILDSNFR